MNIDAELAVKIMYDICRIENYYDRLTYMQENHPQFYSTYPIVVKYMALTLKFDKELFIEMYEKEKKERPKYKDKFKYQAEYVKNFLVKCMNVSRLEAKKVYNSELEEIEREIEKIEKEKRKIEKREKKKSEKNQEQIKEEFLQFLSEFD